MIFVTIGTQDKKFYRLLEAIDKLNIDEKIIIQAGTTEFKSEKPKEKIEVHQFISKEDFNKYMNEASMIITHAGVATIIQGLKLHKKMIVAARLKKYKEHVNDHQLQILENFTQQGYILPLYDFNDLEKLIKTDFIPKEFISNNEEFNKKLMNEINN